MSNRKESRAPSGAILAILVALFSSAVAHAQGVGGYAPGVNPSNPQDLTNRGNPQSLTVPGGSNRQDLVRQPTAPKALSPANPTNLVTAPLPSSPSLTHTHIDEPTDQPADTPSKKVARRRHHGIVPQNN